MEERRMSDLLNQQDVRKFSRARYYLDFSLLFLICLLAAFLPFLLTGKSLIRMGDGHWQHVKALAFYSEWLRSFFRSFFTGHIDELPLWTFSAGYGADVIGTFHYYVVGDPFAFTAVFFSRKHMASLYTALIFLRLYCAGICFSELCFYTKHRNKSVVLSGAIAYLFCSFTAQYGVRHPFFLNYLVFFPLLVLGIEKLLKEKKIGLYAAAVFLSAVSNAVFFYMIVVLIVLYAVWRAYSVFGRKVKEGFLFLLKLLFAAVPATMLGGVTLVPFIAGLSQSQRSGEKIVFPGPVTPKEIFRKGELLLSDSGTDYIVFSGILLAAIILLFLSSEAERKWKVLILLLAFVSVSHYFSFAVSAFTYMHTRWIWAISLAAAYLFVTACDQIRNVRIWQTALLLCVLAAYLLLSFRLSDHSAAWSTRVQAVTGIVFVCLFFTGKHREVLLSDSRGLRAAVCRSGFVLITCISAVTICFFRYSPRFDDYVSEFCDWDSYTADFDQGKDEKVSTGDSFSLLRSEAYPVERYLGASDAFRYSGNNLTRNSNAMYGTASNQYYWSVANSYIDSWMKELAVANGRDYMYDGVEGRMMLLALTGVRYYNASKTTYVPYGFTALTEKENPMQGTYPFYRSRFGLPLGIVFDHCVPREDYRNMDPVQRQQALLEGVVVSDKDAEEDLPEADCRFDDEKLSCTIRPDDGVKITDEGLYQVTRKNSKIHISFSGKEKGETYLYLKGLDVTRGSIDQYKFTVTGYYADGQKGWYHFSYFPEGHRWTDHKHDYIIHTGYDNGVPMTGYDLVFGKTGTYAIDLQVLFQPLAKAGKQIERLQRSVLTDVDYHDDGRTFSTRRITGKIDPEKDGILFLSIPYERGWTAYVDGSKRELMRADTGFSGLRVGKGDRQVELRYMTPGLKEGILLAAAGAVMLAGYAVIISRKKRKGHAA